MLKPSQLLLEVHRPDSYSGIERSARGHPSTQGCTALAVTAPKFSARQQWQSCATAAATAGATASSSMHLRLQEVIRHGPLDFRDASALGRGVVELKDLRASKGRAALERWIWSNTRPHLAWACVGPHTANLKHNPRLSSSVQTNVRPKLNFACLWCMH